MRVPRQFNPQTQVSAQQRGYQRAAQGGDLSGLGESLASLGTVFKERKKSQDRLTVNRRLMQEANDLGPDFDARVEGAPLGDQTFLARTRADYEKRHEGLLGELRDQGIDDEFIQDAELRLGSYRDVYLDKALAAQNSSYYQKVDTDIDDLTVQSSQYAGANPQAVRFALTELERNIYSIPDISAEAADKKFRAARQSLIMSAGAAEARLRPEDIIRALDPKSLKITPGTPGSPASGANLLQRMLPITVHSESRGNPNAVSPVGAEGLMQVMPATQTDPGFGIKPSNGTPEDTVRVGEEYLVKMMEKYDNDPAKAWAAYNLGPAAFDKVLKKNPQGWLAKVPKETRDYVTQNIATLAQSEGTEAVAPTEDVLTTGASISVDTTTGIPALDLMDGQQRNQVLAWARQTANQNDAEIKAAATITHQNSVAALRLTGENSGQQLTLDQYKRIWGDAIGGRMFAELDGAKSEGQFAQHITTASTTQVNALVTSMKPQQGSPNYAVEAASYANAQAAAQSNLAAREADPAGYMLRAFPNVARLFQQAKSSEQRKEAFAAANLAHEKLGTPLNERNVYSDEQITQLSKNYNAAGGEQKIAMLRSWAQEIPSQLRPAFLSQMHKTSVGKDFILDHLTFEMPNHDSLLTQVFIGRHTMATDPARRIENQYPLTQFRDTLGSGLTKLNPEFSATIQESAVALFAAQGGTQEDFLTGNSEGYVDALRQMLGGIRGNEETGFANIDGSDAVTILPPTVTATEFENWKSGLRQGSFNGLSVGGSALLTSNKKTVSWTDIAEQGDFVLVGPGLYEIHMQSDGLPLFNENGRPFTLRLNKNVIRGGR